MPTERKAFGCKLSGNDRTNDLPENPMGTACLTHCRVRLSSIAAQPGVNRAKAASLCRFDRLERRVAPRERNDKLSSLTIFIEIAMGRGLF